MKEVPESRSQIIKYLADHWSAFLFVTSCFV